VINGGQSLYIAIKKFTFEELEQNKGDRIKDIFVLIVVLLSIIQLSLPTYQIFN
jgi:hypothetical protein